MYFEAVSLTAKPSKVHVNTGGGCPFATLNENYKKLWEIFAWQANIWNELNSFTISEKLSGPAGAFARKTNTTARVMHLNWQSNDKKLIISIYNIDYKNGEKNTLTSQLEFSSRLNLLKFIGHETLIHTYGLEWVQWTYINHHRLCHFILHTLVVLLYFSNDQPWRIGINLNKITDQNIINAARCVQWKLDLVFHNRPMNLLQLYYHVV